MVTDDGWGAKAVAIAFHGLSKAGDQSSTPGPAESKGQLAEVVTRKDWNGEFSLINAISWTFLIRVRSGRFQLHRHRAAGNLLSEERLDKKAAMVIEPQMWV